MSERELILTEDGSHSIFAKDLGVSYHSVHGAIQESQHVFIEAGLNYLALKKKKIKILEIGLGTGLNALMTFVEANSKNLKVHYTGIEAYPLTDPIISQLKYSDIIDDPIAGDVFHVIHNCRWKEDVVVLNLGSFKKVNYQFQDISYEDEFDLIYFDAFDPNTQPELWEEEMMRIMKSSLKPGGVLVTYCAKGSFKRTLKRLDFILESIPGPPGKREMTRAIKPETLP